MSNQAQAVLAVAAKEVGTKEGPNNQTKYGAWYGLDHNPWCAMFVSWVFDQAKCLPLIAQTPKGYASCPAFEAWAKGKGLLVDKATIQPGDILLFDFSGKGIAEHTGIAISVDPHSHLIMSYEGNTGPDHVGVNQANGDGAYLKNRAPSAVRAVVRPKWSN